ncbi:hypothetical protein ZYGR_0E00890 [Zygosaccharomyces rouxii]|nr:hypothetical protein ZYGR_0E00890 [Zygosaccharomyces rouxii]
MDIYESERLPLPQPLYYRNPAAGAADAATRAMPGELPTMNWKIPSITRQNHQHNHAPIITRFPITPSGHQTPSAFTARSVVPPHATPMVQINSAFALPGDSAGGRNDRSNGTAATSNIPSMMPTVAGTTAGHQGPSLPLPHVAATMGQAGAGVMAASVGAM